MAAIVRIMHCNQTTSLRSLQMRCGMAVMVFLAATGLVDQARHLHNESSFSHSHVVTTAQAEQSLREKFAGSLSQKLPLLKMQFPPAGNAENCYVISTLFTTGMACSNHLTVQQAAQMPVLQPEPANPETVEKIAEATLKEFAVEELSIETANLTTHLSDEKQTAPNALTVHQALTAVEAAIQTTQAILDETKPSPHTPEETNSLPSTDFANSEQIAEVDTSGVAGPVIDNSTSASDIRHDQASKSQITDADQLHPLHQLANTTLEPIKSTSSSETSPSAHEQAHNFQSSSKNVQETLASNSANAPLASKHFASRLKENDFPFSFSDITLNSIRTELDSIESDEKLSFVEPIDPNTATADVTAKSGRKNLSELEQGFLKPVEDSRMVIMIDPGHGGSDVGTIGPAGTYEKEITLDIAKRVQIMASLHKDIKVVLSRSRDDGLSRARRITEIQLQQPDFLLSLHLNNIPQKDVVLVETYYTSKESRNNKAPLEHSQSHSSFRKVSDADRADSPLIRQDQQNQVDWSRRFATEIQSKIFAAVQSRNPRAIDAGVKDDNFFVLTRTGIPGALVEMTCLSNSEEEQRLGTESYRNELAMSLMDAIRSIADLHQSKGAI